MAAGAAAATLARNVVAETPAHNGVAAVTLAHNAADGSVAAATRVAAIEAADGNAAAAIAAR